MLRSNFWHYLLLLLLAGFSAISGLTVGFNGSIIIPVREMSFGDDTRICVTVSDGVLDEDLTLELIYQARFNTQVGVDFEESPASVTIRRNQQGSCFTPTILDDDKYEAQNQLFINLTSTDSTLIIDPHFRVISIVDDDVLLIAWERPEYTVMEQNGFFEVCITINGSNTADIGISNIRFTGITAEEGEDYVRPAITDEAAVHFSPGSPRRRCYNFSLIVNIDYEPTESFIAVIQFPPTPRILYNDTTTIYISDYNVVVQQQPETVHEGLQNLLNYAELSGGITCNITSSEDGEPRGIECSALESSITLELEPCAASIVVSTRVNGVMTLSRTLMSNGSVVVRDMNISLQVVTVDDSEYYILESEFLLGLRFPSTAIPLICPPVPATTPPATTPPATTPPATTPPATIPSEMPMSTQASADGTDGTDRANGTSVGPIMGVTTASPGTEDTTAKATVSASLATGIHRTSLYIVGIIHLLQIKAF